jgi:predicted nucleic acid-binding protein
LNYLESGSKARKAILDTNIIYSALYKPEGVCGKILLNAMNAENRLLSIDFAKEELSRNMESKLRLPKKNIDLVIEALPLEWIHRDIYAPYIQRAGEIVRYRSDSPFVAASIATGFPLITGDKHLRTAKVRRVVRVYRPGEFLNASSI